MYLHVGGLVSSCFIFRDGRSWTFRTWLFCIRILSLVKKVAFVKDTLLLVILWSSEGDIVNRCA